LVISRWSQKEHFSHSSIFSIQRNSTFMAYDPEARQSSNTAMIIGVAVLVLVIGAIAFFATRPPAADNTVVITQPGVNPNPTTVTNTVIREVPAAAPPVVIVPKPSTSTVTTRTHNSTTVIRQQPTPVTNGNGSNPNPGAAPRTSNNTNVTINVPPSGATSGKDGGNAAPTPVATVGAGDTSNAVSDNALTDNTVTPPTGRRDY